MYVAALKGLRVKNKLIKHKKATELLEAVDLARKETSKSKLSLVMKQRLGIAQAMLNNPRI